VDGTDSGSCPVASFGVNGVEPSRPITRKLVRYLVVWLIKITINSVHQYLK
jgi:hypothetical protein